MYATSFVVLPLAVLSLLAPAVLAQNRCQMFVTAPSGSNFFGTGKPGFGEITRDCTVSPEGAQDTSENDEACATLSFFETNDDESIFVPGSETGLAEDVEVRIFRQDLSEGFVKFAGQDLNWQGDQCDQVGSDDLQIIRCEFDC